MHGAGTPAARLGPPRSGPRGADAPSPAPTCPLWGANLRHILFSGLFPSGGVFVGVGNATALFTKCGPPLLSSMERGCPSEVCTRKCSV